MECVGICSNSSEGGLGGLVEFGEVLKQVGRLFYIVPHSENFQYVEQVPNYFPEVGTSLIMSHYVTIYSVHKGFNMLILQFDVNLRQLS